MNKIIRDLKDLATEFLTDEEAVKLNELIRIKAWNSLRVFLSDLSDEYEIRQIITNPRDNRLEEWLMIEKMNDIAIELAVQMNEVNEEESTERTRRKRIVRT